MFFTTTAQKEQGLGYWRTEPCKVHYWNIEDNLLLKFKDVTITESLSNSQKPLLREEAIGSCARLSFRIYYQLEPVGNGSSPSTDHPPSQSGLFSLLPYLYPSSHKQRKPPLRLTWMVGEIIHSVKFLLCKPKDQSSIFRTQGVWCGGSHLSFHEWV